MNKIDRIRREFPTLRNLLFFSASTCPLTQVAITAMQQYVMTYRVDFSADPYAFERTLRQKVRSLVAALIRATPDEIVLTQNTSSGINLLAGGLPWKPGENVVLKDLEHPSSVYPWLYQGEKQGLEVRQVRSQRGIVPIDELLSAVDKKTRVLVVSHVEYTTGHKNDIGKLADAVHEVGGILCVDAFQSIGVVDINVAALGIDALATGGWKRLYGPKGSGFAFIRSEVMQMLSPPTVTAYNVTDAEEKAIERKKIVGQISTIPNNPFSEGWRKYEAKGLSPLAFTGLSASLGLLLELEVGWIEERIAVLVDYLCSRLEENGQEIRSPCRPEERAAIIIARIPYDLAQPAKVQALGERLRAARIVAEPRGGGLRIGVHAFNTPEEIDQLVNFISAL